MTTELITGAAEYCRVDDTNSQDFMDCCNAAEGYLMSAGAGNAEDGGALWKLAFEALTLHLYDSRNDSSATQALPVSLRLLINQLKGDEAVRRIAQGLSTESSQT